MFWWKLRFRIPDHRNKDQPCWKLLSIRLYIGSLCIPPKPECASAQLHRFRELHSILPKQLCNQNNLRLRYPAFALYYELNYQLLQNLLPVLIARVKSHRFLFENGARPPIKRPVPVQSPLTFCKASVQHESSPSAILPGIAFITGGGRGLGLAIAISFAKAGSRGVVIVDIQDDEVMKDAKLEIESHGSKVRSPRTSCLGDFSFELDICSPRF